MKQVLWNTVNGNLNDKSNYDRRCVSLTHLTVYFSGTTAGTSKPFTLSDKAHPD